jgi:hypothetical protein
VSGSSASGDTAQTLILVGLILDVILEAILLLVGLFFLIVPLVGAIILGLALIGLLWVFLVYLFSYQRVREGDYEGARTPTLVFAILSLLSVALIPGILFLIAYVKLGDAIREEPNAAPAWGAPAAPAAPASPLPTTGSKFCEHCGRANPAAGIYCQGCGAPLR